MGEKDSVKIRIGKFDIGIIGLEAVIAELAPMMSDWKDGELGKAMVERLNDRNYIPDGAKEEYERAFVREFRKAMGQPFDEGAPRELEIKVLGMGCTQCNSLVQTAMELLGELNLPASLEHVTDIRDIAAYGVMGTPALVINGRVMAVGKVPSRNQIKTWLIEART